MFEDEMFGWDAADISQTPSPMGALKLISTFLKYGNVFFPETLVGYAEGFLIDAECSCVNARAR